MSRIGTTPMPEGFPYRELFLKGRPCHSQTDPFRIRHPSMDIGRRAKIFAPFDALCGFKEAIAAQEAPAAKEAEEGLPGPDGPAEEL